MSLPAKAVPDEIIDQIDLLGAHQAYGKGVFQVGEKVDVVVLFRQFV